MGKKVSVTLCNGFLCLCYLKCRQVANHRTIPSGLQPCSLQHIILSHLGLLMTFPFLSAEHFWEPGNWTQCSATCGPLGVRLQRPQCVMASGREVSEALCGPYRKPLAGFQSCNIQDCPARYVCVVTFLTVH